MKIIKINPNCPDQKLLQQAVNIILNDGVIGYPTETVYGLGANALSNAAVNKIFHLKKRERNKPILIISSNIEQVKNLVTCFTEIADVLSKSFWPGPLTIVFNAAYILPKSLMGKNHTIGLRIPDNKICLELLRLCGVPLTSTSANLTGGKSPVCVEEIIDNFGDNLDLIIDSGIAQSRISSTVLDLSKEKPLLLRHGVIEKNEIEKIIGFKINEIENKE